MCCKVLETSETLGYRAPEEHPLIAMFEKKCYKRNTLFRTLLDVANSVHPKKDWDRKDKKLI